jgi:hypothetical protein
MRTDRRIDMMKLIVAFLNFEKATKIIRFVLESSHICRTYLKMIRNHGNIGKENILKDVLSVELFTATNRSSAYIF